MDEESLHRNWVERAGMPEEEFVAFLTFGKECMLSGYVVSFHSPPVSWDKSLRYYSRQPWTRMIARFETKERSRRGISGPIILEYNWKNEVRKWVVKTWTTGRSCYKTVEAAVDFIGRLLKSYESCGI